MRIILMFTMIAYGFGCLFFEHKYELAVLLFIFGILFGIWNSIDRNYRSKTQ